jgi:hypothetical protein
MYARAHIVINRGVNGMFRETKQPCIMPKRNNGNRKRW